MVKKLLAVIIAAALCVCAFAGCTLEGSVTLGESDDLLPSQEFTADFTVKEGFKFGFICIHDENSTYDYNFIKAAKKMQEILGLSDDQVIIKTCIPEANEAYEAAVELANAGCDCIFADSFGHEDFILKAAQEYPNIQFGHATGVKAHVSGVSNFHNAFANIYEGRYCAGVAAGLKLNEMIANGEITEDEAIMGYVGAFTYAEVISGFTSFYLGAKSVCPSVTMKVRFTGSWYDQALEAEAAEALITNDNCVLISQHADSLGAPATCERLGVPNVSYNGSTYEAGPTSFLISSAIDWTPYFLLMAKCVSTGTEIPADWCGGIADGSIVLSGINQDVMAEGSIEKINAVIEQFKAGTLKVFDTSTWTVDGKTLTSYLADVDGDYVGETEVIHDGYFDESGSQFRSGPYFDINIDGITYLNTNFG